MRRFAFCAVLLGLAGCGGPGGVGGGGSPPPSDTCTMPSGAPVDSLTLGAGNPADLSGGSSPLMPLSEGSGIQVVRGGQGLMMLGFVLSVSGASAPDCLSQTLVVSFTDGGVITQSSAPLTTYAEADGTRQTHPLWLPASYPMTFAVDAEAGGQSLLLHLHLDP